MSRKNDYLALQLCTQDTLPSQRAGPSTRTWHSRIHSPMSLLLGSSSQADADLLDPLDDITLDIDLEQRSTSSATLLSRRVSSSLSMSQLSDDPDCSSSECNLSTRLSESRQSRIRYSLHVPGQRTAERAQRLRALTAAIIKSMPATCEDVTDVDEHEPHEATKVVPVARSSGLRRIPGVSDLRRAFRGSERGPVRSASTSSLGASKASYELGILARPTPPLSARSSLFTLVDAVNASSQSSGDAKTLCESTLSSMSVSSRFASKVRSTFLSSRASRPCLPTDPSQPTFPSKHVRNLSITQSRRHVSLNLDARLSRPPGETVWSCAKISQSEVKRAARRGHTPRRVFSSPIAVLSP